MHALIADDDRIAREILARNLRQWGFEVVSAVDGGKAWAYLETVSQPTLAIVDWMMPELDGPSICRRMRAERPTANVYLMLLTSLESRSDIVAGLNAGARAPEHREKLCRTASCPSIRRSPSRP